MKWHKSPPKTCKHSLLLHIQDIIITLVSRRSHFRWNAWMLAKYLHIRHSASVQQWRVNSSTIMATHQRHPCKQKVFVSTLIIVELLSLQQRWVGGLVISKRASCLASARCYVWAAQMSPRHFTFKRKSRWRLRICDSHHASMIAFPRRLKWPHFHITVQLCKLVRIPFTWTMLLHLMHCLVWFKTTILVITNVIPMVIVMMGFN